MISRDLLHSTVTNQVAFEQRDLYWTYGFECAMDRRYDAFISNYIPSLLPV